MLRIAGPAGAARHPNRACRVQFALSARGDYFGRPRGFHLDCALAQRLKSLFRRAGCRSALEPGCVYPNKGPRRDANASAAEAVPSGTRYGPSGREKPAQAAHLRNKHRPLQKNKDTKKTGTPFCPKRMPENRSPPQNYSPTPRPSCCDKPAAHPHPLRTFRAAFQSTPAVPASPLSGRSESVRTPRSKSHTPSLPSSSGSC